VNPDPVAAGLRLLLAAARDARHAAGDLSIQVELSRRLRSGSAGPRDAGRFGIVGRLEDAGQSRRITTAVTRRLQDGASCRDALIDALGPTGEAAAIDGLAWAWLPGRGFHLLRSGPEDCGSAHARMRRLQAGRWDGAADALAAEWAWNPLLHRRPVLHLRQGQATL
jgi:hypothetical protein